MSRPPTELDADARYREWVERIQRIKGETFTLFWNRRLFRAVQRMFETNETLQTSGADLWQWIAGLYGRDAVMAIRRELDGQAGVLNLFHLLHDMEAYSHILTRARYRGSFAEKPQFPRGLIDQQFERFGGPPGPGTLDDHIPAAAIAADRAQLQHETRVVFEYAQRLVAHRTPVGELPLTLREVDTAMRAVFQCLRKYYGFLAGGSLVGPTPVPQFDWLAPFRFAWAAPNFNLPRDEFDP
jgi:hypothetical protein